MSSTVFYHADCLDGFAAAYAAWRALGDTARYRPLHHGEGWEAADVVDRDVFILDFSFPPARLLELAGQARSVRLIDHHTSARAAWAGQLQPDANGGEFFAHPELPLTLHFDLVHAGGALAWAHFQPGQPLPRALAHVEDIDLWRFALPGTRPFCRALRLQPWSFADWDRIVRDSELAEPVLYPALLAEGKAIERFFAVEVERLSQSRLVMPIRLRGEAIDPLQARRHGHPWIEAEDTPRRLIDGVAINASSLFASELGNRLAERHGGFALIWELAEGGIVRASLRACGQVDVALIAANYGGGGHPNAAGFRLPMDEFFPLLG